MHASAIELVHHDKHVVCINKPRGLLSQPDHTGTPSADQVAASFLEARTSTVHRLDKRATGCLLLALTKRAATRLTAAFAHQHVTKSYLVGVKTAHLLRAHQVGHITRVLSKVNGRVIALPLTKSSREGDARGRICVLRWHAAAVEADHALLCVTPRGGFKHQVRAMLGSAGLPLVGDYTYGGERVQAEPTFLALHAAALQLDHPIGGYEPLHLRAAIPAAWSQFLPEPIVCAAQQAVSKEQVGQGPLWGCQPELIL
jgi:23S rRNA-/tRNA-specific pseudouridylate synthase